MLVHCPEVTLRFIVAARVFALKGQNIIAQGKRYSAPPWVVVTRSRISDPERVEQNLRRIVSPLQGE